MNFSVGNICYHNFLAPIQVNRIKLEIMPYGVFLKNNKLFKFRALIAL